MWPTLLAVAVGCNMTQFLRSGMDDASPSVSELGLLIEHVIVLASRATRSSCGGGETHVLEVPSS